jgi:hypothetical protein
MDVGIYTKDNQKKAQVKKGEVETLRNRRKPHTSRWVR